MQHGTTFRLRSHGCHKAVIALCDKGPKAKAAVPSIVKFFSLVAADYAGNIAGNGRVEYFKAANLEQIALALGKLGRDAEGAVADIGSPITINLSPTLPTEAFFVACAEALGKIGSKKGLPYLRDAAKRSPSEKSARQWWPDCKRLTRNQISMPWTTPKPRSR
jgi:hypothetical protein